MDRGSKAFLPTTDERGAVPVLIENRTRSTPIAKTKFTEQCKLRPIGV